MLCPLYNITNEEQYEKRLCDLVTMENMGDKHNSQHSHGEAALRYRK